MHTRSAQTPGLIIYYHKSQQRVDDAGELSLWCRVQHCFSSSERRIPVQCPATDYAECRDLHYHKSQQNVSEGSTEQIHPISHSVPHAPESRRETYV
ncbi:MAG: hypothetical protein WCA39_15430 [Nitrososphaeraceae archaeon]